MNWTFNSIADARARWLPLVLLVSILISVALAACSGDDETTTTAGGAATTAAATTATTAGGGTATTGATGTSGTTGTSEDGDSEEASLYADNCASCHGVSGEGGVGPKLQERTDLTEDQAETVIRQGGGGMPPFEGTLSDDQIKKLARYVVEDLSS